MANNTERRCPACDEKVEYNELIPLTFKRKNDPTTIRICKTCYQAAKNVLALVKPHYPDQIKF
ncbi:hypothetical protein CDO51_07095 [Natranaerobius trueperi]|uniref:Uncharacterized protein n=1 Tax=Natranaerobius trueperi TaxID=759412 RepID=A0A226BY65_9FIRM|nr:hypothetical protein CDO51_07095 [Natranaerobius trueperi]